MSVSLASPVIREDVVRISSYLYGLEILQGGHLVITGGTGFFGKWVLALCSELVNKGWNIRVTVISRDPQGFLQREPYYRDSRWLNWVAADISDLSATKLRADFLLHAATDSSVAGQADRLKLLDNLYNGTRQVMDLVVRSGVKRVLLTGSGAQYGGTSPTGGWHESDSCACLSTDARQAYGEGKRLQDMLGALYAERHDFDVIHTRGFAFVGPGLPLNGHFAVGNFIRDAMFRERITVDSAGLALRSYLYGADLAGWLLTMLARGEDTTTYNVGSDQVLSIADLAQRIGTLLAPEKPVDIAAKLTSQPRSVYVPNISRASALGLNVWTSLDDALLRTACWLREVKSATD